MLYRFFTACIRPILHRVGLDLVYCKKDRQASWGKVLSYQQKTSAFRCSHPMEPKEKVIWQFWWQGRDMAPEMVVQCLRSVERQANGWRVVVIDQTNIEQYVRVPETLRKKHEAGLISHTHFSDYLRVKLPSEYGGVWIDATVYLTAPIPDDLLNARFFMFKTALWAHNGEIPPLKTLPLVTKVAGNDALGGGECAGSSWFLVADRHSAIVETAVMLLEDYWQTEDVLCDYFLLHKFLSLAVCTNEFCRTEYLSCPLFVNIKPHLLYFSLNGPYDKDLWNCLKKSSPIHKLSYKNQNPYPSGSFGARIEKGTLA